MTQRHDLNDQSFVDTGKGLRRHNLAKLTFQCDACHKHQPWQHLHIERARDEDPRHYVMRLCTACQSARHLYDLTSEWTREGLGLDEIAARKEAYEHAVLDETRDAVSR